MIKKKQKIFIAFAGLRTRKHFKISVVCVHTNDNFTSASQSAPHSPPKTLH
jgi:hypothetical protein